jgi:NAD(P)-dependent dehydrogenase (short-subunit alcohol dehydrogenase family)
MANIRLEGKVAVVTGAGGGLGRAHALLLASRGARVVVNDLGGSVDGSGKSASMADQVVEEIRKAGGEAVANYESVATAEGGKAIIDSAVKAFGRIDILINNAGILRDKSFANLTEEMWDAVVSVHLKGAYNCTKPAFDLMKAQNYGRIIFTTSGTGLFGNFGQTTGAAKLGLVGLREPLRRGRRYNIHCHNRPDRLGFREPHDRRAPDLRAGLVSPLIAYLVSDAAVWRSSWWAAAWWRDLHRRDWGLHELVAAPTPEWVSDHIDQIMDAKGYTIPQSVQEDTLKVVQLMQKGS